MFIFLLWPVIFYLLAILQSLISLFWNIETTCNHQWVFFWILKHSFCLSFMLAYINYLYQKPKRYEIGCTHQLSMSKMSVSQCEGEPAETYCLFSSFELTYKQFITHHLQLLAPPWNLWSNLTEKFKLLLVKLISGQHGQQLHPLLKMVTTPTLFVIFVNIWFQCCQ